MADKEFKSELIENEEDAISFWEALGFEDADSYSREEMMDIINSKINDGELKLEEVEAAIALFKDIY